jgi:Histidine kinase-, DNA gyrase B-, and HSP90-like ATPase
MGETRVDLFHLLEDLADAYPGALEETILTEIVANSLDSGASRIVVTTAADARTFTATDDGVGMRRADLRRFHDIAATTKTRGETIGFAGVGIKLGLLVSEAVVTETRRGKDHLATTWALAGRKRAPWRWIEPPGLLAAPGTAVRLQLQNALSPLLDPGFVETTLRRHFEPLFDELLDPILATRYPRGVAFEVNGRELPRLAPNGRDAGLAPVTVRLAGRRKPTAFGYLVREPSPIAEDFRGIAVSTFGKVIKRGWDWLGVTPATPDLVRGLIEVPPLAASLTLNKADFLRSGTRGATYLAYRKALQEAVTTRLTEWGDAEAREAPRRRATRPVEKDVEKVLLDLLREFPLLAALVERRPGGRRRLPTAARGNGDGATGLLGLSLPPAAEVSTTETEQSSNGSTEPRQDDVSQQPPEPAGEPSPEPQAAPTASVELPSKRGRKRPTRLGLSIQFESRPEDAELGRLIESTVWVNDAHPAYRRAVASRAEGYHLALTVAMALSAVAVDAVQQREFVSEFLARWGSRSPKARS